MYSRDLLKKKAMKSNLPGDWLHFKEKRNAVNQLVRRTKKLYYQDEIKNSAGNPKETWKVLNNLMGKKTNGTELNKININECDSVTKAKDIANALNTHFTDVGLKLASQIPSTPNMKPFNDYLRKADSKFSFDKITPCLVLELLKTSNVHKAVGVD